MMICLFIDFDKWLMEIDTHRMKHLYWNKLHDEIDELNIIFCLYVGCEVRYKYSYWKCAASDK